MRFRCGWIVLAMFLSGCAGTRPSKGADDYCPLLRTFAESVKPDESRRLEFDTFWFDLFKSKPVPFKTDPAHVRFRMMSTMRCLDNDYAPATAVCQYLFQSGMIEFPGDNVLEAVKCLSPETHFGGWMQVSAIDVVFRRGSGKHGQDVTIHLGTDTNLGGEAMIMTIDGY